MNIKKILITIILFIILIPTCILTYRHFTTKDTPSKPSKEEEEPKIYEKYKGQYTNLKVKVDASLATQPLMNAFLDYFAGKEKRVELEKDYTNTHPAYEKLIKKETDLIIVTEPSTEELEMARKANVELEITKVVNEGFVFFVNAKNPLDNLKLENIVDIYSGKVTSWETYNWDDEKIIAYQRPTNSGSQTGMLSLVMKDTKLKTPTTEEAVETMGGIIDIVADYDNNKYGLGYSYYYYANIMYHNPNIKFLGINGVKPNYDTIKNETYPLMTAYYIVTLKNPSYRVKDFKNALLSKEGGKVAKEAGYVPIY